MKWCNVYGYYYAVPNIAKGGKFPHLPISLKSTFACKNNSTISIVQWIMILLVLGHCMSIWHVNVLYYHFYKQDTA